VVLAGLDAGGRKTGERRVARRAGSRAHDVAFDEDVVGSADHDEMLDMIPAHQHQLALPVEIEGVHDSEARLARPVRAARTQPASGDLPQHEGEQAEQREDDDEGERPDHRLREVHSEERLQRSHSPKNTLVGELKHNRRPVHLRL
jgi:hypothetical protein